MSASDRNHLKIFSGTSARELTQGICTHLDLPIGLGTTVRFPDGETMVKVDEDVRGRDVYVVLSTCEPVNDNLMELLVYIDCLKRASAKRITAVIPYYGYARQDRKDEGRVPITAKLVANLIVAAVPAMLIAAAWVMVACWPLNVIADAAAVISVGFSTDAVPPTKLIVAALPVILACC